MAERDNTVTGALWVNRRLTFTFLLCILVFLLAIVVLAPLRPIAPHSTTMGHRGAATPAPTATWHPTYSIVFEGLFTTTARRSGQLAYRWFPQLDATPRSPVQGTITCTFALYGPFPTRTEAEHAGHMNLSAVAPPVAAAPVMLDNWTSEPHPDALTIPESLALGYYVAIGHAAESGAPVGEGSTNIAVISIAG